jgi:2-polyprenyl-3-methyl-5-hydroxy-6-metoxy-1,4-benzoquinol methylase
MEEFMEDEDFFNKHSDFYGAIEPTKSDFFFINFISKNQFKLILDIGGGGGCFARLCKKRFPKTKICVVDPSIKLLNKQQLNGIEKIKGWLPDHLNVTSLYDFVHIKEVLHHLTKKNIKESKKNVIESLESTKKILNENGFLLIHEIYYDGYLFETSSRTIIFYLLKIQNFLKITIPHKHFRQGLSVCFFTRKELIEMFNELNFEIIETREKAWTKNIFTALLLIKSYGRVCFILKRR